MKKLLRWSDAVLAALAVSVSVLTPLTLTAFGIDNPALQGISQVSGSLGGLIGSVAFLRIMNRSVSPTKTVPEGSSKILGKAAADIDASAVQLWLKYENNLSLLLKFPELIRVNSEINRQAQSALETLMSTREAYNSGKMSSATYHDTATTCKLEIKNALSEATKIKDAAFTLTQRAHIKTIQNFVEAKNFNRANQAILQAAYLQFPVQALREFNPQLHNNRFKELQ